MYGRAGFVTVSWEAVWADYGVEFCVRGGENGLVGDDGENGAAECRCCGVGSGAKYRSWKAVEVPLAKECDWRIRVGSALLKQLLRETISQWRSARLFCVLHVFADVVQESSVGILTLVTPAFHLTFPGRECVGYRC